MVTRGSSPQSSQREDKGWQDTGSNPVLVARVMNNVSPNCTMLTDGKTSLIQLTAESHTVRRPDVSKLEVH